MPQIIVRNRNGGLQTATLARDPIKVGRAEHCQVVLRNDGEVSREHIEIWLGDGGRVMVADLNSKNGTRVDNSEPFRNATRVAQRRVYVGEHEIEIRSDQDDSTQTVVFSLDENQTTMGGTHYFPSSQRLDLNQKRLELLISLGERLGGTFERRQLLEQAIDTCVEALSFERALIALKTARGEPEHPVTRNMQRDENGAFKVSRSLINRALIDGERAIVNNVATDLAGNITESLVRFPICSALCVPIMHKDEILGVVYGDRVTVGATYKPRDVDFFAAIAQQVGVGLVNLRMAQEQLRTQRILAELEHARTIQRLLLPPAPLRSGNVTIEGYNEPSSAVGGDYFDYFEMDDGRVCAIIADVTGHGLPAALLMANLQAAVRVGMTHQTRITELMRRVNRHVCTSTASEVFITAILAVIDVNTGLIEMINAGHPTPLIVGKTVRPLTDEQNSLPLGIDPEDSYHVIHIEPDSHLNGLLLYTDGMSEAAAPNNALLGFEPVAESLASLSDRSAGNLIRSARTVVKRHLDGLAAVDDMTFLAIQFGSGR